MKSTSPQYRAGYLAEHFRHGLSSLEVIVSFVLLMSVLSVSLPLMVRHERLLVAQRHYRLALDELSNQLDRITAVPAGELPQALQKLALSEFAAARLSSAKLTGELKPADVGQRITLHLTWKESQEQGASMTAWVFPRGGATPAGPARGGEGEKSER